MPFTATKTIETIAYSDSVIIIIAHAKVGKKKITEKEWDELLFKTEAELYDTPVFTQQEKQAKIKNPKKKCNGILTDCKCCYEDINDYPELRDAGRHNYYTQGNYKKKKLGEGRFGTFMEAYEVVKKIKEVNSIVFTKQFGYVCRLGKKYIKQPATRIQKSKSGKIRQREIPEEYTWVFDEDNNIPRDYVAPFDMTGWASDNSPPPIYTE